MTRQPYPLALIASLMLATPPALADDIDHPEKSGQHDLQPVQVSALPLDSDANLTPMAYDLLDGELLFQRSAATLGGTLDGLPGVHADTFGGGASRPVIRGQSAPRVSVLSDGSALFDASAISPDHAITTEPMLARKIEVLRGPSTLLYGGGAIGGVVNVLDDRVPTRQPDDAVDGFVEARGDTVAREHAGAASLTARAGDHMAVHVEGARRQAHDYTAPDIEGAHVPGTWAKSNNGSIGASWIGKQGYLGLAFTRRSDTYGLPGHNHEFEECTANGANLDCSRGHHHGHGEQPAPPYVDLDSHRVDLRGEYRHPSDHIKVVRLRSSYTDYRHYEIEEGERATTFRNRGYDLRVDVEHQPLAGWRGVIGTQYSDSDFRSEGEEALVPGTRTRIEALFAVERYPLANNWQLEVGARHERQQLTPDHDDLERPGYHAGATSFSTALTWVFHPDYALSLSATRSQRLPQAQEMYARGAHIATDTYECGLVADSYTCGGRTNDAAVHKETSRNIALNLRKKAGRLTFDLGVFRNQVDNYIYARTLDQFEAFRLIKYTQDDVIFTGAEAEMTYHWSQRLSTTLFGDTVRGRFRNGDENLPRIPADRLGARLNTWWRTFDGELAFYRAFNQKQTADFERATSGYNMLSATVSWHIDAAAAYTIYLRGNNLLDETVWNHASFLAHTVPEAGRNLTAGLRVRF